MTHKVFAYGSLLNSESFSKTINRRINFKDLIQCTLNGYIRTWTASCKINIINENITRDCLFLDLSKSKLSCNGALVSVSDEELELLKIRERGYELIKVDCLTENEKVSCYTFKVPDKNKTNNGFILSNYIRLVNNGLVSFNQEFKDTFWDTTEKYKNEIIEGKYSFL